MVWTSRPFGRASADEPWVIVALGSLPEEFVITVAKFGSQIGAYFFAWNLNVIEGIKLRRIRAVLLLFLIYVAMGKPCLLAISCRIVFPTNWWMLPYFLNIAILWGTLWNTINCISLKYWNYHSWQHWYKQMQTLFSQSLSKFVSSLNTFWKDIWIYPPQSISHIIYLLAVLYTIILPTYLYVTYCT